MRAAVWQSIFTHDMRRYRRTLFERMSEFATLVTGPSGTAKELVARAIAQSPYLPFDDRRMTFPGDDAAPFFPINISALSPTLVESELFGHRRGSFTGAVGDRKGWLEACSALGSVFLDELGDMDLAIQVKLLRVIETRTFHPVGDTASRRFQGKLIAATNRDLAAGIRNGRFREDLYYRLCSDQISTPSLSRQLSDSPQMLRESHRLHGPQGRRGGSGRVGVRGGGLGAAESRARLLLAGQLSRAGTVCEECPDPPRLQSVRPARRRRYCAHIYRRTGSYEETARRLQPDRRTVKAKIALAKVGRGSDS